MVSCVFPGSFDPVTCGHLDLITRASYLFDRVTVTVMINVNKHESIPLKKRMELLEKAVDGLKNVTVDSWEGLLTDYMAMKKEHIILRGVRNGTEYEHEMQSALANRLLNGSVETVYLPADPRFACVSSSAVKEIIRFGGDICSFIPSSLQEEIVDLLSK